MRNKKTILWMSISLITLIITTGCGAKIKDITPKRIQSTLPNSTLHKKFSIVKGESLHQIIKKINELNPDVVILDKTISNITVDRSMNNISLEDLLTYIRLNYNRKINFRKYTTQIYSFEERIEKHNKLITQKEEYKKIPDMPLNIQGKFTYYQVFNMLRDNGINVYANIVGESDFSYDHEIENFSGNLKDFLTYIASKEKLFIEIDNDGIQLKDVDTKYYDLKLPQLNVKNQSGTGETGVKVIAEEVGLIDDLKNDLESLLSSKAKFSVNQSDGTVIVTGGYEDLKIADKKMKSFMDRYGKSINLEMTIYEVSLSENQAFGIDYNGLINQITGLSSVSQSFDIHNSTGLFAKATSPNTIKFNSQEGEERINSIIFNFLNKYGKAKVLTKPTLETINNLPVSLSLTDEKDYIKEINQRSNSSVSTTQQQYNPQTGKYEPVASTTTTGNSNLLTTETNVVPDTFIGGFELKLHPRIVQDRIKIAIENVVSKLNGLETIDLSDKDAQGNVTTKKMIQLKDVSKRQFSQVVSVAEGEMAIVGGYIDETSNSHKNTLPGLEGEDSNIDFLTSAKDRVTNRKEVVITIKAKVID